MRSSKQPTPATEAPGSANGENVAPGRFSTTSLLLALGAVSLVVYVLVLVVPFSVLEHGGTPLLSMTDLTDRTPAGIAHFLTAFGVPFLLYLVGFLAFGRRRIPLRLVLAFPVICGGLLILVYPLTAIDVFLYASQARVLTHYDANPFVVPPATFTGDPFLQWTIFTDTPTAYGPLWTYLSAIPTMIAGEAPMAAALGIKMLSLGALVAAVVLTYHIAEGIRSGTGTAAAYLLGWNPVVLWSTAGAGHNDIVMMAFVLLAFFYIQRNALLAVSALVLGALVKFAVLVLVPLFVVYLWRREHSPRFIGGSLLLAAVIGALVVGPLWEGPGMFSGVGGQVQDLATMSPGATAILFAEWLGLSQDNADTLVRWLFFGAFALIYAVLLARVRGQPESLMRHSFWALFFVLILVTFWFRFWYVLWLVPLAAITLPVDRKLATLGVIFSGTAILIYGFTDYFWIWLGFGLSAHIAVMLVVFTPPVVAWCASVALPRLRTRLAFGR
ncbi:MAG: hypothetical protein WD333_01090 [Dehalococcoidia bacterium]